MRKQTDQYYIVYAMPGNAPRVFIPSKEGITFTQTVSLCMKNLPKSCCFEVMKRETGADGIVGIVGYTLAFGIAGNRSSLIIINRNPKAKRDNKKQESKYNEHR